MRYVVTHHFTQISKKACPAMIEPEAVALILLAAGRSPRFGVADKLAAPLHGRPLVQHAATTLSPLTFGRHIAVCSSSLLVDFAASREEERRVGKGGVWTCTYVGAPV